MNRLPESQSLEIEEPQHNLIFSSSDDPECSLHSDLDYSKDDDSLSFLIDQPDADIQRPVQAEVPAILISNEPPQRKRREIFQKYRQPAQQVLFAKPNENVAHEDDLMKTFDEIFNIGSPKKDTYRVAPKPDSTSTFFKKKTVAVAEQAPSPQERKSLSEKKEEHSQQSLYAEEVEIVKLNEPKLTGSQIFKIPHKNYTPEKQRASTGQHDILGLEDLDHRFSYIEGRGTVEFSKDAVELAEILGSEIFKEEEQQTQAHSNHTPSKIELPVLSKDAAQEQRERVLENTGSASDMSKASDLYQKIDLSASVANSVMLQDSRFQGAERGGFLGVDQRLNKSPSRPIGLFSPFAEKPAPEQYIEPEEHLEQGLPIFLRRIRYLNSIYPNFKHPFIGDSPGRENEKLQKIVAAFLEALKFLDRTLTTIREKDTQKARILSVYSQSLSVELFMKGEWQECDAIEGVYKLEPKMNFTKREWNEKKVCKALENYRKITDHYHGMRLNLTDPRGVDKYVEIRKKFWNVESNLVLIAEDMYAHTQMRKFPPHYHEILAALTLEEALLSNEQIRSMRVLLQKVKILRSRRELLCCSPVGNAAIARLDRMIAFSSPY